MAKGKSFFGLKRGSTKSLTFQVLNGQQIVKDRVFEVKNPRTTSQMVQRMVMATATAAYSHMREIVDHSFEGISYGQQSMAAFIKENVRELINDVKGNFGMFSYNPFQDRRLYASPFVVSKGSLSINRSLLSIDKEGNRINVRLSMGQLTPVDNSVQELLDYWHVKVGDIITIPFIYSVSNNNEWKFGFVRLIVKATSNDYMDNLNMEDYLEVQGDGLNITMEFDGAYLLVNYDTTDGEGDEAFGAIILSRKSNMAWLRSNAAIIFPGSTVNNPTAATALATYPVGVDYILNGGQV